MQVCPTRVAAIPTNFHFGPMLLNVVSAIVHTSSHERERHPKTGIEIYSERAMSRQPSKVGAAKQRQEATSARTRRRPSTRRHRTRSALGAITPVRSCSTDSKLGEDGPREEKAT
jgi:hypothetical protein